MLKESLQIELWAECNSQCKYCYLGEYNKKTSDEVKMSSLKKAYDVISDLSIYERYDAISYLGGEFFQGQLNTPEIREMFFKLIKKTAELYNSGIIRTFWLYVTLTIGNQEDLYEVIKLFDDKTNFWILTSYDTIGRFHTQQMLDNWKYHMHKIHQMYPEIPFNITTILTEDMMQRYLNNEFTFLDMGNEYGAEFFLKNCSLGSKFTDKKEFNEYLPNFFPKRTTFLKFLTKFRSIEPERLWDKIVNVGFRANRILRVNKTTHEYDGYTRLKNEKLLDEVIDGCDNPDASPCGHSSSYQAYIDSDKCMLCDKFAFDNIFDK